MTVLSFPEIDSTNLYLKRNREDLRDLTFAKAEFQSAGRGSHGRGWVAEKGVNLLFSILIKDPSKLSYGSFLSLIIATGVASFLENEFQIQDVSIKWPNDIYVRGKKICGILIEGELSSYLTIGIGLNVNQKEFVGEYRRTPTSLSIEAGKAFDLESLSKRLFAHLEKILGDIGSKADYLVYFNSHDFLRGRHVYVLGIEGECVANGVNDDFALKCIHGSHEIIVTTGEISIL